jgi:hypothetical protein
MCRDYGLRSYSRSLCRCSFPIPSSDVIPIINELLLGHTAMFLVSRRKSAGHRRSE